MWHSGKGHNLGQIVVVWPWVEGPGHSELVVSGHSPAPPAWETTGQPARMARPVATLPHDGPHRPNRMQTSPAPTTPQDDHPAHPEIASGQGSTGPSKIKSQQFLLDKSAALGVSYGL